MSKHKDIIDAAKTGIDALAPAVRSVFRDRDLLIESDLTNFPVIVLTMGGERDVQWITGSNVLRAYDVMVSIYFAQNQTLQSGLDEAKARREAIRKRMVYDGTQSMPLLGVAGLYDCTGATAQGQDVRQANAGYESAGIMLTFYCSEVGYA